MMRLPYLATALFLLFILAAPTAAETGDDTEQGYYSLTPSLVTNLQGKARYLRCDVQLRARDARRLPEIELHAPALRHTLLMLLVDQDGGSLQSTQGRETLRDKALQEVQGVLQQKTGEELVDEVFFTTFYVQ